VEGHMDNKILIIGDKETFIIRVLLKKMADAGISVEFITPSIEKIDELWYESSLVTYYLEKDEKIQEEIKTFLVDKMAADDKQIVIIGEPSDTEDEKLKIPPDLIYKKLSRPLDYAEYIECVQSYSKKVETGELKKSILIVDDDPNYMSLVRGWLKGTYKVSMATSGLRAIKWLGSNKVDLILLDFEMPVTDGPQVLEMLRDDEETKKIPVMFLTGRDDKDSVMSVMELRPEGYFLKTIGKDELMAKLKMFFLARE